MKKLKALILAAGHGSRLRPLSQSCPKPFVPFLGVSPAQRLLSIFDRMDSIDEIAINSFHASEVIDQFSKSSPINFYHSHEKELLNTGGGIANLKDWLDGADLLVTSGDILADFDFEAIAKVFKSSSTKALVAFIPHVNDTPPCDIQNGELKSIRECGDFTFAGCYVLSSEFIADLDMLPISIIEPLQVELKTRPIKAFVHNGYWQDLGTPQRFSQAQFDCLNSNKLAQSLCFERTHRDFGISPIYEQGSFFASKEIHESLSKINVSGSIFNGGCTVNAKTTRIDGCLVMPKTTLQNSEYTKQIIGPEYTIKL